MTEQPTTTAETVQPAVGTLVVNSDVGVTVNIVSEQPLSTWHKTLDALWDLGIIGDLPDDAYRVLGAFGRLRKSEDGIVNVSILTIASMVKRSKSYVYSGRAVLLASPHRLLAARTDLGRDTYHVLPGWSFAGRTFRDGGKPSATAESSDQRFRHGGRLSATAENPPPLYREARARSERIETFVDDELFLAMTKPSQANALGGPFPPDQARMLVEKHGAEAVRIAVKNANALGQSGKIQKGWRNYVVGQLNAGVTPTLFTKVAAAEDDAIRNTDLVNRLISANEESDYAQLVKAWWASRSETQRAKLIGKHERSKSDDYVWRFISQKAFDAYQRGSFRMPAQTQTA